MILAALKGLAALPRLVDAVESLGDIATAQLAQQRKDEKDSDVLDIIAAARERRVSKREAARLLRDSGEEPSGDGGRDSDGGGS
jgi:hypothetical protein